MSYIKPLKLLYSGLYHFYLNKKYLNDDIHNNCNVCRKVSENIIKDSKVDYKVIGKENILQDEPILVVSNHICFYDIAALYVAVNKDMPFAAAKELILSINSVLIDRNTDDLKEMKKQLEAMEKAISTTGLILFPEGECSYGIGDIKEFKKGGFIAAKKNDISIVPTYINYEKISKLGRLIAPHGCMWLVS